MLVCACTENGREQNSPKCNTYKFGKTRLSGKPTNRWQDKVRENGNVGVGNVWQESDI